MVIWQGSDGACWLSLPPAFAWQRMQAKEFHHVNQSNYVIETNQVTGETCTYCAVGRSTYFGVHTSFRRYLERGPNCKPFATNKLGQNVSTHYCHVVSVVCINSEDPPQPS